VVIGCDDLTDIALDRLLEFHRKRAALATIGLVERQEVEQYGDVVTAQDGRITGFQEKPAKGTERSNLVNTGVYAFTPAIFEHIPAATFYDFGKQVFPALQQAGAAFYGYDAQGAYWSDIVTPEEYRRASFDVLNGVVSIPNTRAHGADPSARIAGSATIAGSVWIGRDAWVGEGARVVGPSVIGDRVRVEAGATVERSIVWQDAVIGEGAALRDAVVGIRYRVQAGTRLDGSIVANDS